MVERRDPKKCIPFYVLDIYPIYGIDFAFVLM